MKNKPLKPIFLRPMTVAGIQRILKRRIRLEKKAFLSITPKRKAKLKRRLARRQANLSKRRNRV